MHHQQQQQCHCTSLNLANRGNKTCFWAYVRQPHNHIGWSISMPFASINPTNLRTYPYNFEKNILNWQSWKSQFFFESAILEIFLKVFFCFIPMKISQSVISSKDGLKFWWLPWFPVNTLLFLILGYTVYVEPKNQMLTFYNPYLQSALHWYQ